jgi:damage-control phosphatase, subfamily I
MKSWRRDIRTHLEIIGRFLELAEVSESEAQTIRRELERYIKVRLQRKFWMQAEITRFHTEWYREFYRIVNVADPYARLKETSNRHACEILGTLKLETFREAVLASIVANKMDFGAVDHREDPMPIRLSDFENISLFADDFVPLLERIQGASKILYLLDNHGEVLFDKVVLEKVKEVSPRCEIQIAAKESPMLNDVTVHEARELGLDRLGQLISTGSNCFGVPEDEVSKDFLQAVKSVDVIIAKGQAYLEFWLGYDIPNVFNLAHSKIPIVDEVIGEIPVGVNLIIGSARYGKGKQTYPC